MLNMLKSLLSVGTSLVAVCILSGCIFGASDPRYSLTKGNPFDEALKPFHANPLLTAADNIAHLVRRHPEAPSVERSLASHGAQCRHEGAMLRCAYEKPYPLYGPFGGIFRITYNEFEMSAELAGGSIRRIRLCLFQYTIYKETERFEARKTALNERKPECHAIQIG